MHEDGGIDTDDVLVEQHHRLPPILLYVVLELYAVLAIVIDRAEAVVDVAGGEYETILLAMRYNLLENVFLLCHYILGFMSLTKLYMVLRTRECIDGRP